MDECTQELIVHYSRNLHMIGLIQMGLRSMHLCRPLGIVGQQQQTFAGFVETPDWREPGQICIQSRIYSLAALLIAGGCHHTARFVQHQIDFVPSGNRPALDFDPIPLPIDWPFWIALNGPIDRDSSCANKREGRRARAMPELRQCARQPHSRRS